MEIEILKSKKLEGEVSKINILKTQISKTNLSTFILKIPMQILFYSKHSRFSTNSPITHYYLSYSSIYPFYHLSTQNVEKRYIWKSSTAPLPNDIVKYLRHWVFQPMLVNSKLIELKKLSFSLKSKLSWILKPRGCVANRKLKRNLNCWIPPGSLACLLFNDMAGFVSSIQLSRQ